MATSGWPISDGPKRNTFGVKRYRNGVSVGVESVLNNVQEKNKNISQRFKDLLQTETMRAM